MTVREVTEMNDCPKCGKPWSYPPCGPTHAAIYMEGGSTPDVESLRILTCFECKRPLTSTNRVDIKEFEDLCYDCYSRRPKHICVDFDGVLAEYTGWKGPDHLGEPRTGAAIFLENIVSLGFKVIILTTRNPEAVYDWAKKHGLLSLIDRITREKPPAVVYLDDRALCFMGNFAAALEQIKSFKPYWKEG
jgi:hypothetical protein